MKLLKLFSAIIFVAVACSQTTTLAREDIIETSPSQCPCAWEVPNKIKTYEEILSDTISKMCNSPKSVANEVARALVKYKQLYKFVSYSEVLSVIHTESYFNDKEVGLAEETGLMQILPSTESYIAKNLEVTDYDLFDIDTNIHFGMWYLNDIKKKYGKYAFIVYNQGLSKELTDSLYNYHATTEGTYYNKILRLEKMYREELENADSFRTF